jgi:hypothetical protein
MTMLWIAMAGYAFAGKAATPEIDASSGVSAVTLLSGGMLVLRGRRRAK